MYQCSLIANKEVVWVMQSMVRDAFWFGGMSQEYVDY